MSTKKCYVLIVSNQFPKSHNRAGDDTGFIINILNEIKKHTIRMNYDLWKRRVDEINKGNAYLSVRSWSGLPYKSKQIEHIEFHSVGIQKLQGNILGWWIDDYDSDITSADLAINDGLKLNDFKNWFKKIPDDPMAIIHFTEFRYPNSKNEDVQFRMIDQL